MLSATIILSAAFPALAATKHHRIIRTPPAINVARGSGPCSPIHPPFCSAICRGLVLVRHQIAGDAWELSLIASFYSSAKMDDEVRRIAANIVKLPDLAQD